MTLKDKVLAAFYNATLQEEQAYEEHLHYIRFHRIDEVDCLETVIRKTRLDCYNEMLSRLLFVLGIKK